MTLSENVKLIWRYFMSASDNLEWNILFGQQLHRLGRGKHLWLRTAGKWTHTHAHTQVHTHTHTCTHAHTHMHTRTHMRTRTHMHTHTHNKRRCTYIHTYLHTCINTTYVYIHTYIHTYIVYFVISYLNSSSYLHFSRTVRSLAHPHVVPALYWQMNPKLNYL